MSKHGDIMFVRIDGEPFLSRAFAYRKAFTTAVNTWHDFRHAIGALDVKTCGWFQFSGEPETRREEWIRAGNRKTDWWRAKKGSALMSEIGALPELPRSRDIFGDCLADNYCYETAGGCNGSGAIGFSFLGPNVGWTKDIFICCIPDPASTIERIRKQYPDAVFTNGVDQWILPIGLTRISEAENNLIFAQAAVDAEEAEGRT